MAAQTADETFNDNAWGLDGPNPSHGTLFTQATSWPNPIEEGLEFFPTMSQPPLSFQPDGPHIEIPRVRPVSAPSPNYQSTQSNSSATLESISQAVEIPTLNITSRRNTDSFPTQRNDEHPPLLSAPSKSP
jgi:hypothetical protein